MKNRVSNVRLVISLFAVLAVLTIALVLSLPTQKAKEERLAKAPRLLSATYDRFADSDEVTRDIRSGSSSFYRIQTTSDAERASASKIGRVIGDYGSFVVVAVDGNKRIAHSGVDLQQIETSINLPGTKFDPISAPPAGTVGVGSLEKTDGNGYYIVQFGSIATDEMLDSLRDAGLEILQYVPNQAFFVYGDNEAIAKAAAHSRVRWAGSFLPAYKLSNVLNEQLTAARSDSKVRKAISPLEFTKKNMAIFDVAVFERENLDEIGSRITNLSGGEVKNLIDLPSNYFNVVRVELPLDQVENIANIPGVISIDSWGKPQAEDERAAQIVAGNYTNSTTLSPPGYNPLTQFLVDGTNVTVSMADDGVNIPGNGGFYITSGNTLDGPLRGTTAGASGGHGHLNASIIAGAAPFGVLDPTGYNYGLGIAPKANIINLPFLKAGSTSTEAQLYDDTVSTNGVNGVRGSISNNSWGNGLNSNVYDAYAATFDGFVMDASTAGTIDPITLVFSAGNSGASGLTRPKVAKNLIATGSSENLRPEIGPTDANNIDDMSTFSARGPAADTRVKPDIVAPGGAVSGSAAGTGASVTGSIDANHNYSYGTSHAAPQISGIAALFTQFWKTGNGGVNPSPALIKAAVISTGQNMTGVGATNPLPNGDEGWGRFNAKFMLNTGVATTYINQTRTFGAAGDTQLYTGTVADNTKPLRVTLVWTDPPGTADPALVNNLDLTVTVGGNTYKGNVFSAGLSTTGGVADTRNNVENVWLPAGTTGAVTVSVSATAINGDGVLGNADTTDQHFALVVYNSNVIATAAAVVSASGPAVVTAENRLPANSAPDPGETVTVNLPLSNIGTANTTNLVATLQNTGGVTASSGAQNYGVLVAGGASVTRAYTFTASGVCGSDITLTLALNDNGTNLGTVTYTMRLGTVVVPTSYSNTAPITINDAAAATPYPSIITVAGAPASITNLRVTLTGLNHTFPDDVDMLLVGPTGQKFIMLSDTGGTNDWVNTNITLDDNAAALLSDSGANPSGTYKPTNVGASDAFAGAPAAPYLNPAPGGTDTFASAFGGTNPNGNWSLYIIDDLGGDVGTVSGGWSLTFSSSTNVCSSATASGVEVSGRVLSPNGRGLRGARVIITDQNGVSRSVLTGAFGYYSFADVESGQSYVVSVKSRRYTYSPRVLQLTDNVADFDFTPDQ